MREIPNPYHVLRSYGLKAKKSLGQNFLTDIQVVERIAESGGITQASIVFEIGALPDSETYILAEYKILPTGAAITEEDLNRGAE